jgi:hypothetical protein
MPYTIVLHPTGEEPIVGEIENLPSMSDVAITINNPRRLDGKELHYLAENVITVIWPLSRLNFIEIMPTKEEEKITGFYRD